MSTERNAEVSHGVSQITVYYRHMDAESEATEYLTEPISISVHGFLMRSAAKLTVGSRLLLRVRVPIEISGSPFQMTRHTGRVACEVPLDDGTIAYRVEL